MPPDLRAPGPSPRHAERAQERRFKTAWTVGTVATIVPAVLISGWILQPLPLGVGLGLALLGGIVAGALAGQGNVQRLHYAVAASTATVGATLATQYFLSLRDPQFTVELLLPLLLGGLPGLLALILLSRLGRWPGLAHGLAVVLALGLLGLIAGNWPAPADEDRPTNVTITPRDPGLALHPDERHLLVGQFGDKAEAFLRQVDITNSLVTIYGLEGAARSRSLADRLSGALKELHREMQTRVGHGADPDDFETFLAVEQRALAFILRVERRRVEETRARGARAVGDGGSAAAPDFRRAPAR